MILPLKDFIPEKSGSGFIIDTKENKKSLHVSYKVLYKQGGYKKVECSIPKVIETNNLFWEALGILQGEMKKSNKNLGYANTSFTNSNPDIVNHVLDFFEEFFNIKRNSWRITIIFNSKDFPLRHKEEFESKIRNFWINNLKVPNENFTKTYFNQRKRAVQSKSGSVNLKYCNSVYASFFKNMLENLKGIIENDRTVSQSYIRGLIAAEGSSYIKNGFLNSVEIGASRDEDFEHYKKCLRVIGIKRAWKGNNAIKICGWDNFYELWKIKAFKLHKKRELKFTEGFLKNEETRKLLLLKKLSEQSKPIKDLEYTSLARCTVHQHLTNHLKSGLVERSRIFNKDGSWYYVWKTTRKGEEVLKSLDANVIESEREIND